MDSVYPQHMSLLHRRVVPKKRRGTLARYRTQPVTFSEIQVHRKTSLSIFFMKSRSGGTIRLYETSKLSIKVYI